MAHGRLDATLFRPYNGPGGVAAFFQELNANVGIEAFEPQEFVTEANRVLVTGSSRGQLVKTTSRMFNNRWVMAFSVRDGKITQFEEYADTPSLGRRQRTRRSAQEIINEETIASVSNEMLHRVVIDIAFPSSGAYAVHTRVDFRHDKSETPPCGYGHATNRRGEALVIWSFPYLLKMVLYLVSPQT